MIQNHVIEINYKGESISFYLPNKDDHIQKVISNSKSFYELEMLEDIRNRISEGSVIVDAGANIGNHTLFFGKICKPAKVYSFEPFKKLHDILRRNIELNDLKNIVVTEKFAVGRANGKGKVYVPDNKNFGMTEIKVDESGVVKVVPLDSYLKNKIERLDVLKVDVEGMELDVLMGANDLIVRYRPLIYIECVDIVSLEKVKSVLSPLGYDPSKVFNSTPTYLFKHVKTSKQYFNKEDRRKKISFFAGDDNNFHFVMPIISYLKNEKYEIRVVDSKHISINEIEHHMRWSDISWFDWANGPIVPASQLSLKCKIICRLHRYEVYTETPKQIKWENIDYLIFVSPFVLEQFKKLQINNITDLTNVSIIPNGIDLEKYDFRVRERGYDIAHITRFHGIKNPALALQILAELVRIDSRYTLHIAGNINDYCLYQYMENIVSQMDLQKNYKFYGKINDINKWLNNKQYILSTSIVESQGLAIMEGMAKGLKPIIHNSLGDPSSTFDPGYIFNTVNDAVNLITENKFESDSYRKLIKNRYDITKIIRTTEKLIFQEQNKITEKSKYNNMPCISIIIPTYNREKYLEESINSALNQNYDNFEVLVIDDGSTDDTEKMVKSLKDTKLRYYKKPHTGAPETRNFGLSHANGEYIIWLGSDDVLLPDVLKKYGRIASRNEKFDIIYSDLLITDEKLNVIRKLEYENWDKREKEMLSRFIMGNIIPDGGTLIKKTCYTLVGFYNEKFKRAHDYEWWTRIVKYAKFRHSGITAYKWRWHDSNMSSESVQIDHSYDALIVKMMLDRYKLKDLFPQINWNSLDGENSIALAYSYVAVRLARH